MFASSPPRTIVELLQRRVEERPDALLFSFEPDAAGAGDRRTRAELLARARHIATALVERRLTGERVLLLFPPGLAYVDGFFACLVARAWAVPAYPPLPGRTRGGLERLRSIAASARPSAVLTTRSLAAQVRALLPVAPELEGLDWLCVDDLTDDGAAPLVQPPVGPTDVAFLQYTSGSTAEPRGVIVRHDNLMHNLGIISEGFGDHEGVRAAFWLPPYHDMGLIGGILGPLWYGGQGHLMSPLGFLMRPRRWLELVSRHRAAITGAPNFAFDLCARKISEAERERLDLSSLQVLFCAAEPIRAETIERFASTFEPCGLSRGALYTCYGLAESTLMVTGGRPGRAPSVRTFDAGALERGLAEPAAVGRRLVGCGYPLGGQQLRIVDPASRQSLPPGTIGEIWVAGPSVASGYHEASEESRGTFGAFVADVHGLESGPFLRTGDLGTLVEGELFVTGRLKDLVIVHGRNHHPQDLEATLERHDALRPSCSAVFSMDAEGVSRLWAVVEIKAGTRTPAAELAASLRRALSDEHQVVAHDVIAVAPGSVPKTSSGKVMRAATRAALRDGALRILWRDVLGGPATP